MANSSIALFLQYTTLLLHMQEKSLCRLLSRGILLYLIYRQGQELLAALDSSLWCYPQKREIWSLFFTPNCKDYSIRLNNYIVCPSKHRREHLICPNIICIAFSIILNTTTHPFKKAAFGVFKVLGNCCLSRFGS